MTLRDPTKDEQYYHMYADLLRRRIDERLKREDVNVLQPVAGYHLGVARTLYSAGDSIDECRQHLLSSAQCLARYHRSCGQLSNLMQVGEYLEGFSVAFLADMADTAIDSFNAVRPAKLEPAQTGVLNPLGALLTGRTLSPATDEERAALAKSKGFSHLPGVFAAAQARDVAAFATSMESYLVTDWGKSADRAARATLKQPVPQYSGLWCMFSAAMCILVGTIPPLSKKALRYFPVELVAIRK